MLRQDIPFIQIHPSDTFKPWLPVIIINPHSGKKIKTYGLIDTGADECALPAQYADILGHNLQKGLPKDISTGNGITIAYSHTVSIEIDGFNVDSVLIDFMPNLCVPLLGVKSFLSNFILSINYPAKTFSLKN
ncbi:retroviral-like aspartic protease family protein [Candidatus Saganbacteria bacterium]|nr:retroviral-like aspartic protease family protein [Candidatus Saganbacteria bacterium]